MERRTGWLSGSRVKNPRIGVLHSTFLVDVGDYINSVAAHDERNAVKQKAWILKKLRKVPDAQTATKWLVVSHITAPQHWTLVEVHWGSKQLRFYESFAAEGRYDIEVKMRMLAVLDLCQEFFPFAVKTKEWQWIGEQRGRRQRNWYDCGPFVAADIVSLFEGDQPSAKNEKDMKAWPGGRKWYGICAHSPLRRTGLSR
ncbi:hypothetical protein EXIGLDRAFT_707368 [Exidia glandulosa HHB12029]|uniref:Ubiquitin-like protease family profile domain-containing protein n=1 Tax=Exidia glandulosa HHB12029 TaxID=1314781 RepID=A0A165JUT4_EXIGL|nr:hypothetical protein EXIGLDRAFT_707368 [Exidia glandulosa HHB12029]